MKIFQWWASNQQIGGITSSLLILVNIRTQLELGLMFLKQFRNQKWNLFFKNQDIQYLYVELHQNLQHKKRNYKHCAPLEGSIKQAQVSFWKQKGVESALHLITIATLCGYLGKDLVCKVCFRLWYPKIQIIVIFCQFHTLLLAKLFDNEQITMLGVGDMIFV